MNRYMILLSATVTMCSVRMVFGQEGFHGGLLGVLNVFNTGGQSVVDVAKTGVQDVSSVSRSIYNRGSRLGSKTLQGGTNTLKNAVGAGVNFANIIQLPGYNALTKTSGKVLNTGLDLNNMGGQVILTEGDRLVNHSDNTFQGYSEHLGNMASEHLNIGHDLGELGVDTGVHVMQQGTGGLELANENLDSVAGYAQFMSQMNGLHTPSNHPAHVEAQRAHYYG